jgi:hypothetical protein
MSCLSFVNVLFCRPRRHFDVPRRSGWPRRPSPPPTPPRTGHGSSGSPSARTHSCSGSLASLLVYWDSRSSANRNNGCSLGRPLRQADHRIQIALKSAPRAMGKTLVSAPSARIRLGRLATAVPTQDALPVARLVVPNTISFPWLQGKQLGQPPDFSMISPPELQPATTMTLEIDPQVRYQQNPSEAAQHAAVRAMVDYVVAAASWAAVMDKTSLLKAQRPPLKQRCALAL